MITVEDKNQNLLDILNGMVKRLEPFTYSQINHAIKAGDEKSLREFEELHDEVGLALHKQDDGTEVLGSSTIAIMATITAVLVGKRLAVKVAEDGTILGFMWYQPKVESQL